MNLFAVTCLTLSIRTLCEMTKTHCWTGRQRKKRKPFLVFYIYPNPNSSCVSVAASSARAKTQQHSSIRSLSVCLYSSQLKQSQCCLTQKVPNTEGHRWATGPRWNVYSGSTYCKATLTRGEKRLAILFWRKHTPSPVSLDSFLLFFFSFTSRNPAGSVFGKVSALRERYEICYGAFFWLRKRTSCEVPPQWEKTL